MRAMMLAVCTLGLSALAVVGAAVLAAFAFCLLFWAISRALAGSTDLAGKTVLVTGAGRGIGLDMCKELVGRGSTVLLLDIDEKALADAERELERVHGAEKQALWSSFACNVTEPAQVRAVAERVRAEHGVPHVLINNAGVVCGRPLLELRPDDVRRTFSVNVFSHFYVLQEFLPAMLERNSGTVVTIASTMAFFGAANLSDYCGSKFAAYGVHESMRLEVKKARKNVKTLLVCPNAINTGMFKGISLGLQWLVPMLESRDVATQVVKAIENNREYLTLPWIVSVCTPIARTLPAELRDYTMNIFGASSGMDTFVGRGKQ